MLQAGEFVHVEIPVMEVSRGRFCLCLLFGDEVKVPVGISRRQPGSLSSEGRIATGLVKGIEIG